MAECCKYGLELLSIDSQKELECIAEMNNCERKFNTEIARKKLK
jgi:hypothetical protein